MAVDARKKKGMLGSELNLREIKIPLKKGALPSQTVFGEFENIGIQSASETNELAPNLRLDGADGLGCFGSLS